MTPEQRKKVLEQRNLIATAFLGFLIGLAYQEAVEPVRESIRAHGLTFGTAALFLAFFLSGLATFLVGSYGLVFSPFEGVRWFLSFVPLIAASVVLIFLAGVASVDASRAARYGFLDLFIVFTVTLLLWNLAALVWAFVTGQSRDQRASIGWSTGLSAVPILVLGGIQQTADRYANGPMAVLLALVLGSFLVTVVLLIPHGVGWTGP